MKNRFPDRRIQRRATMASCLAVLFILTILSSGCGSGATVLIDQSFEPPSVTVKAGESVTWKSEDRRNHQIMSGAPPVMTDQFVSPVLQKGDSWTHTFEDPGEFPYHDMRTSMIGEVVVTGP